MAQAKAEFAAAKAAVAKGEQVAAQAVDDLNSTVGLGNSHCAEGSVGDCANAVGMLGTAAVVEVVSDGAASEGSVGRNAGQLHHIATDKSIVGGFTKQFEKIFAKAGKNLQWGENLMQLEGHAGRHSELYHKWVLDKLTKATNGLVGEEAAKALTNTLREIRAEIQRNPRVLRGDGI
jgi:hypothetical protein